MTGTCPRHGSVTVGPMGECPQCGDYCLTNDNEELPYGFD